MRSNNAISPRADVASAVTGRTFYGMNRSAIFATAGGAGISGSSGSLGRLGQAECGESDQDLARAGRVRNCRGGVNDPAAVLGQAGRGVHHPLHEPSVDADPHAQPGPLCLDSTTRTRSTNRCRSRTAHIVALPSLGRDC
jgi:hypothetical protein